MHLKTVFIPPTFLPTTRPIFTRPTMTDSPTGPYNVSTADVLLPSTTIPLRVRLFYPSSTPGPVAPWFPPSPTHPDETTKSVLQFANIPASNLLARLLPQIPNRPLPATLSPAVHPLPEPTKLPADTPAKPHLLPIAIFSHGLGGSIANYSNFCIQLSSYGFLTLAPEHSDGSAFHARIGSDRSPIPYERFNKATHTDSPTFRTAQTHTRIKDLDAVLDALRAVHEGRSTFHSLRGSIPDLKARLDMDRLVLAGHSFGASTTLAYVAKRKDLPIAKAVCLDGWFEPLAANIPGWDLGTTDVLFVDQAESRMKGSIAARKNLSPNGAGLRDAVKVLGGVHNNASDFPLRIPMKLAVLSGMTAPGSDPLALLQVQNEATIAFLSGRSNWLAFRDRVSRGTVSGLALAELGEARILKP